MNLEDLQAVLQSQSDSKDQLIQMQNARLEEQAETIKSLRATIKDLTEQIAGLQETVNEFQRKLFGTSSERTKKKSSSEDNEEPTTTTVKSHTRTTRKAKSTREDQYGNLPIHKVVIPLAEADQKCPYCNAQMKRVGETFVREEIRITPAKVERIQYYRESWVCPACKKDGDVTFL